MADEEDLEFQIQSKCGLDGVWKPHDGTIYLTPEEVNHAYEKVLDSHYTQIEDGVMVRNAKQAEAALKRLMALENTFYRVVARPHTSWSVWRDG